MKISEYSKSYQFYTPTGANWLTLDQMGFIFSVRIERKRPFIPQSGSSGQKRRTSQARIEIQSFRIDIYKN